MKQGNQTDNKRINKQLETFDKLFKGKQEQLKELILLSIDNFFDKKIIEISTTKTNADQKKIWMKEICLLHTQLKNF